MRLLAPSLCVRSQICRKKRMKKSHRRRDMLKSYGLTSGAGMHSLRLPLQAEVSKSRTLKCGPRKVLQPEIASAGAGASTTSLCAPQGRTHEPV